MLQAPGRWLAQWCYAAWAWVVVGVLAPVLWVITIALPGERRRWWATHCAARAFLVLVALRVTLLGREHLPAEGPFVVVANHASYLDGVVILATLPRPVSFVVHARFVRYRYTLGLVMRRLGVIFVSRATRDTRRLVEAGRQGRHLVVFPEGRIGSPPRLEPFHTGAFVVAAQCGSPVVPMAIRGTRRVLPPDSWRLRRGRIVLRIGPPIAPEGRGRDAIGVLRKAARRAIAERLHTTPESGVGAEFPRRPDEADTEKRAPGSWP